MIARHWSAYLFGIRRPAVPLEGLEEHGGEQREHPRLGRLAALALPPQFPIHEVVAAFEAALRDGGHGVADVGQDGLEDAGLRVAQRREDLAQQRQRFRA